MHPSAHIKWLLLFAGSLLCADTLFFSLRARNLGIWLPAMYGLPLLLLGLFYAPFRLWSQAGLGRLFRVLLVAFYCASILFFACTSLFLYFKGHKEAPKNADALLVLGCALRGSRPTLTLTKRLDAAVLYLNENPDTVCFVSGGQGTGEDIPEALAMKNYLVSFGIDEERIVMESSSMSTYENFSLSYPLITQRFSKDAEIVYLSTYFHVYRAGGAASSLGIRAEGFGAPGVWYITPNDYLRESIAIVYYRLRNMV